MILYPLTPLFKRAKRAREIYHVTHHNPKCKRGLTSQFLANVMLDPLDHFIKESLRRPAYVRFADDFLIFGQDKRELADLLLCIRKFLEPMRLRLHARKCVIQPVRVGVPFLGWRIFPDHRRLRRSTGVRFQRRLKQLSREYGVGAATLDDIKASLASWIGHLEHGDTWRLRARLMHHTVFRRGSTS